MMWYRAGRSNEPLSPQFLSPRPLASRRGQILGQVFVLILAAVVFIMILLYGYRAIKVFSERGEQVALLEMITTLRSKVRSVALDFGSVKRLDLVIPQRFHEVCFVDLETLAQSRAARDRLAAGHPLVFDLARSGTQNVFLFPPGDSPILLEHLRVESSDGAALCVPSSGGRVSLRLEGLGNRAKLGVWA